MKIFNLNYCYLVFALFIAIPKPIISQIPDFSKVPNLHDGDSLNIVYLINNGVRITNGKVIAWFPKDSLSEEKMNEITNMLNAGISGSEKFINAPLLWQVRQLSEPYTFYFRFDRFVSHASLAGFISIPFWRIKEAKAPWLHEIMHEMTYSNSEKMLSGSLTKQQENSNLPLWLYEGLPDYISLQVSILEKLPKFDVFSNSNETNYDSMFVKDMASDRARYILSFIGSKGIMPELSSKDRVLYAPAFYHGSCSFVKFIAENYGIKILLSGISSYGQEEETIEKLAGKPLDKLKKEWLDKLRITN